MALNALLIRHAHPERVEGADGQADPELTADGHAQAAALVEWLADEPIVAVHVSPARRALQTARPLAQAHGLDLVVDDDLTEYDWGQSAYVPFEDARAEHHPIIDFWREFLTARAVDSPRVSAFRDRCATAIERIMAVHDDGTVAIVCHGGVINGYVSALLDAPKFMITRTDYTGFSRIARHDRDLTGEQWVVSSLNEAPHLRALDSKKAWL